MIDRDNEVLACAELPGVEKDDLDVPVSDSSITINAETRHEQKEERRGDYYCCEISHGSFARSVRLPK